MQILGRDLVVTLEIDLVDDRIFHHLDGEHLPVPAEFDVGEQAGGEERLQRAVDGLLIVLIAFADRDVGKNGRRFDALRARDQYLADGRTKRKRR